MYRVHKCAIARADGLAYLVISTPEYLARSDQLWSAANALRSRLTNMESSILNTLRARTRSMSLKCCH